MKWSIDIPLFQANGSIFGLNTITNRIPIIMTHGGRIPIGGGDLDLEVITTVPDPVNLPTLIYPFQWLKKFRKKGDPFWNSFRIDGRIHSRARNYIMGVLAVHPGQGTLPTMKKQEKIAKIVKQSLEARKAALARPANELLKEIYDADTGRRHSLMK